MLTNETMKAMESGTNAQAAVIWFIKGKRRYRGPTDIGRLVHDYNQHHVDPVGLNEVVFEFKKLEELKVGSIKEQGGRLRFFWDVNPALLGNKLRGAVFHRLHISPLESLNNNNPTGVVIKRGDVTIYCKTTQDASEMLKKLA